MGMNNRLKDVLRERNITQSDFADKVKISKSTLSNIINDKQNATLETAIDIARALNLKVEDIFIKQRSREEAMSDFASLVEQSNTIYELYNSQDFPIKDIVIIYKALVGKYIQEYNPVILNLCFESTDESKMNEIFQKVVCNAE